MNQIKKDLEKELQSIALSDEKKDIIVHKINRQKKNRNRENWTYRIVLSAFVLLGIGFSYLLLNENKVYITQTNVTTSQTSNIQSLFASDYSKSIVLILLFILLHLVMKKSFYKKQRTLPVCANCSNNLSYFQALRQGLKGNKIKCPHCQKTQYRTRQSMIKMDWLNFLLPLMTVVAYIYQNKILGLSLFLLSLMILTLYHSPYIVEFQRDAPGFRFNWRWVFPVILMISTGWVILESDDSYAEPQEAIYAIDSELILIPAYKHNDQALFFFIKDEDNLGRAYVKKSFFGWKASAITWSPMDDIKKGVEDQLQVTQGGHVVFGLLTQNADRIVAVGGMEATILNLEMLPADEVERFQLAGMYLWYVESDEPVTSGEVKLLDRETREELDSLKF